MARAHGYSVTTASEARQIEVVEGTDGHRFQVVIGTEPLSSMLFLGRPAATALVAGLVERLTADDPAATGELLDRLVGIVAGERT